jgi:hypothetical protein
MMTTETVDVEPIARQVYDTFLLAVPGVPVEGLFQKAGEHFIVSPALDMRLADGRTVRAWYEEDLMPLGFGIHVVKERPEGSVELECRSPAQVADAFGIIRTLMTVRRDLALMLPASFPLVSVASENRKLVVGVSRALEDAEHTFLVLAMARAGNPVPVEVSVTEPVPPKLTRGGTIELVPTRFHAELPAVVRSFLEADEDDWRAQYPRVLAGSIRPEAILGERRFAVGEACLVGTTFPQGPENIRTYLSLYDKIVLVMPLRERVADTLVNLGVSKRSLFELVDRGRVFFIAPQSVERYDTAFLGEVLDVRPQALVGSRMLAAAVHADDVAHNPLFVFPGTAFDRRTVIRTVHRIADAQPASKTALASLAEGLAQSWRDYEYALHVRGGMTPISGPLACVARALAQRLTGNDYFMEMGAAAANISWASALGAHFAPFEAEGYSEVGHCEVVAAVRGGAVRGSVQLARPSQFAVAEDLLVINNDVDIVDFITTFGSGDLARFRDLVRNLARPGRSKEECQELIDLWNRQVRRYDRKTDRIKSMGLVGLLLGSAARFGMPDLVPVSAVVGLLLPAALTLTQEEWIGKSPELGMVMDGMNATLAGVQPNAVLLARLKKLVKGMK